jgi:Uma2 family endonuclease
MGLGTKCREVINNPLLQNLPFKIELNKLGQILMSPASSKQGILQYKPGKTLESKKRSEIIIIDCSILTSNAVKVADVAGASVDFISEFGEQPPFPKAPGISIEVVSPANSKGEIDDKIRLYLEKGALEVWVISLKGETKFFTYNGQIPGSKFVKGFKL